MNQNAASTTYTPLLGALATIGVGVALLTLRPGLRARRTADDGRHAFITYLRDHLAGSDTAVHVVEQLATSLRDTPDGALFASLHDQLEGDRDVVRSLLADLDASPRSIKRLAGHAAGIALRTAYGDPGELSFFRALEGLAIGIQGKRCLWRAGQALSPAVRPRGPRSFADLEAEAVQQWEAVERLRLSMVQETFGSEPA